MNTPGPFALHVLRWKDCQKCELGARRNKIVFARGKIPCDILFVGEGPGESEDSFGQPFYGPAGKLLDDIIRRAGLGHREHKTRVITEEGPGEGLTECTVCGTYEAGLDEPCTPWRWAFTNLVCCMPKDEHGNKVGEPADHCIQACKPRLEEFIRIAKPRLIVCVGKHAKEWIEEQGMKHSVKVPEGCKFVHIIHPAAILKGKNIAKDLLINQSIVRLRCAVREIA